MKFSLIVPTIHRVQELGNLLCSIQQQDYPNLEVILVDQNPDDRLLPLVKQYQPHLTILHIRERAPGQSRARNIGFTHARGDLIAFPDDDCIYPKRLLEKISSFFKMNTEMDGLLTRVFDLNEDKNAFESCGDNVSIELDFAKAYKNSVSCAIFFRAPISGKVRFNEQLGPGAGTPWACGDETDFIYNCLQKGFRFYYDSSFIVRHPNPKKHNSFSHQLKREYRYGMGKGYFLATHQLPTELMLKERPRPFQRTLKHLVTAQWQLAAFALAKEMGSSRGYYSGLNNDNH